MAQGTQDDFSDAVTSLVSLLRPQLEIAGCLFQHVEPWLNPEDPADLWYLGGAPDSAEKIARIFAAMPNRIAFGGHYHRWFATSQHEIISWSGDRPLDLSLPNRYFVAVGALCEGRFATYDCETAVLRPFNQKLE